METVFTVTRIDAGSFPVEFRTYTIGTYTDFWTAHEWAYGQAKAVMVGTPYGTAIEAECYSHDGRAEFRVAFKPAGIHLGHDNSTKVYATITVTPVAL